MSTLLIDRILEQTSTDGTGSFTLDGKISGYQSFDSGLGVGNACYYCCTDNPNDAWEIGIGTLTNSTTLSRDSVISSSNSGALVNFADTTKSIYVTFPASKLVYMDATGSTTVIGDLNFEDSTTYINKDATGNLTFTDAITGTITLAEMSCPPKIEASDTSVAEGNSNLSIGTNKVLIKWIKITTTSTNWTLTFYSKDDFATKPMIIVSGRNGDYNVYVDYPYEDEDATSEFHYNFTSTSGSETHDITLLGYKLR